MLNNGPSQKTSAQVLTQQKQNHDYSLMGQFGGDGKIMPSHQQMHERLVAGPESVKSWNQPRSHSASKCSFKPYLQSGTIFPIIFQEWEPGRRTSPKAAGRDMDGSDGRPLVFSLERNSVNNKHHARQEDNNAIEKQQGSPSRQPTCGVGQHKFQQVGPPYCKPEEKHEILEHLGINSCNLDSGPTGTESD
jgi:hypothetical protein